MLKERLKCIANLITTPKFLTSNTPIKCCSIVAKPLQKDRRRYKHFTLLIQRVKLILAKPLSGAEKTLRMSDHSDHRVKKLINILLMLILAFDVAITCTARIAVFKQLPQELRVTVLAE